MKRYSAVLLSIVIILLTGCSKQKSFDPFGFAQNFKQSQSEFLVSEEIMTNGNSSMLFLKDKQNNEILITLFHGENSLEIIGCSVTVAGLKKDAFNSFILAAESSLNVFCTNEKENITNIIKNLKMLDKPLPSVALEKYASVYYEYTFQINEAGADLTVFNRLSAPETESELTLREKDDYNSYTGTY